MFFVTVNRKKLTVVLALGLGLLCGLMAAVYAVTKPEPTDGSKSIVIEVEAERDGYSYSKSYSTDEQYLGDFLEKEGLIGFDKSEYGRFITSVMNHAASNEDQSWWCVYINGESAVTGVDEIVIEDGSLYRLELMIGW